MATPWLTVVIPVFNGQAYLDETLESVAVQGETRFEIVALDNGSTDRTAEILQRWSSRLPIRIEKPLRPGNWIAATNRALGFGTGEYACFLHHDDLWKPGRLAALRRVVEASPSTDFVLHATEYIDRHGRSLGRYHPPFRESAADLPAEEVLRPFLIQNVLSIPSALFRRAVAMEEGGLDERLWYSADWDLWLRLAGRGRTRVLGQVLASYRLHPQTQTSLRSGDLAEFRRQHELVFEKHFPRWEKTLSDADAIAARARFSMEMNTALAALATRQRPDVKALLRGLASMGPAGTLRYLRDSRLPERMAARLRGRLWQSSVPGE